MLLSEDQIVSDFRRSGKQASFSVQHKIAKTKLKKPEFRVYSNLSYLPVNQFADILYAIDIQPNIPLSLI